MLTYCLTGCVCVYVCIYIALFYILLSWLAYDKIQNKIINVYADSIDIGCNQPCRITLNKLLILID